MTEGIRCHECGEAIMKGEEYREGDNGRCYCRMDECLVDLAWAMLRNNTRLKVVE
jgi:hypothetical protein